ncbi:hypothetical protein GOP47_0001487 [Adiantum capillus-veneris]|uniref:Uncharacterized protein n=1 Tax=Adiantum capillus-veneris TaxID=13818 RepID=A0A9D4ZNA6_ADICA|nr:hypothetical protein GOP47_0001487 [Adiantum capillus-veneris]
MATAGSNAFLELPDPSKVISLGVANLVSHERHQDVIPFHCNLAPSFGKLKNAGAIKEMDEQLKVIIAGTTRIMSKLVQEAKDRNQSIEWSEVVATMTQNPLLKPFEDLIERNDKLIKTDMNYFKFDGSADHTIVREVETWFVNLIGDEDVLNDTKIDIHTLAQIVAESGARVTDLGTLCYKKSFVESEVLDIGVLRYLDIDNPYCKVYRIKLTAWSDCERVLFVQNDSNGITGVFTCRKYKPRASVIESMYSQVKKKAVEEAEALFA